MAERAMDPAKVKEIVDTWMIPTPGGAYMAGLEQRPVLASASGSTVVDTTGREYLDFQSGQMGAALGHRHPRVMRAIEESARTIVHASKTMLNLPRLLLHERLGRLLAPPLQKSLFLVSGSDSIEAAVDLARNATGGYDVLGLHEGLHGSTSLVSRSLTVGWTRSQHAALAPRASAILAPDCYRCPVASTFPSCNFLCLETSFTLADANFTARPAAVIAEPVLSAGGVIVPPPGYFAALRQACDARGMLLIFDEAQTGLGKTGRLFCYEHDGVLPDILTVSKHFGGGLPLSAVCTSAPIAEQAVQRGDFATRPHAAHPLLGAAGLGRPDGVGEEGMAGRAARIERRMKAALPPTGPDVGILGGLPGARAPLGVEPVSPAPPT